MRAVVESNRRAAHPIYTLEAVFLGSKLRQRYKTRFRAAATVFWLLSLALSGLACTSKQAKPAATIGPPATASTGDASAHSTDRDRANLGAGTLFDRLGGRAGVAQLVDELTRRVAADSRLKNLFDKTLADPERAARMREHTVQHLCMLTGGPCLYLGQPVKQVHKPMRIGDAEWNAFIEDFAATLAGEHIGDEDQSSLLAIVAKLKAEIVTEKSHSP